MEPTEIYKTSDREEVDKICREARRLGHEVLLFANTVEGEVEYTVHFFHKDGPNVGDDEDDEAAKQAAEEERAKQAEEAAQKQAEEAAQKQAAEEEQAKAAKKTAAKKTASAKPDASDLL